MSNPRVEHEGQLYIGKYVLADLFVRYKPFNSPHLNSLGEICPIGNLICLSEHQLKSPNFEAWGGAHISPIIFEIACLVGQGIVEPKYRERALDVARLLLTENLSEYDLQSFCTAYAFFATTIQQDFKPELGISGLAYAGVKVIEELGVFSIEGRELNVVKSILDISEIVTPENPS